MMRQHWCCLHLILHFNSVYHIAWRYQCKADSSSLDTCKVWLVKVMGLVFEQPQRHVSVLKMVVVVVMMMMMMVVVVVVMMMMDGDDG